MFVTIARRLGSCGRVAALSTSAGITAGIATCAAAPEQSSRPGYIAPAFEKGTSRDFESWHATLRATFPIASERDVEKELRSFIGERTDQHLLWQTLRDERTIRRIAVWNDVSDPRESAPEAGRVRLTALVELGDALNGHVGVIHGGFSAALLDDMLGQTTMQEAQAQGVSGAPLTASLAIKYRYPVMANATYLVQTATESIAPRNRPGPPSWDVHLTATIYDAAGHTCVEAKSHYVIKQFAK